MSIYIRNPERIDELFVQLEDDPEDDHHIAIEFRETLVKNMRSQTLEKGFVKDWIDSLETDSPLVEGVNAYCDWIYDDSFDGAQSALDQFSDGLAEAREKDWSNLAVFSIEQLVSLKAELGGFSPCDELMTVTEILYEEYVGSDVHLGNASRLINLVVEHSREADQDTLEKTVEYCDEQASLLRDAENFHSERNRLEQALELAEDVGRNPESFQTQIIESWDVERETTCESGSLREYILLQEALDNCQSFASSSTLKSWRAELQSIAPTAIEDMEEFEFSLEVPDEAVDALIHEFEEVADRESMEYALFSLVQMRPHAFAIPKSDPDQPERLTDALPRKKISAIGTSTSTDYKTEYEFASTFLERIIGSVFNELFDRGILEQRTVVNLVKRFDGLNEDDTAFTEEIMDHLLEGEHVAAFHIGIPHFERVLLKLLNRQGESILVEYEHGTRTNSLGTLIGKLGSYLDEEYVSYLLYMYTDPQGENRRNLTAHGHISYQEIDLRYPTTVLLDILAVGSSLTFDELVDEWGEPETLNAWTASQLSL